MKIKNLSISVIASLALLITNANAFDRTSAWEAVEDYSAVSGLSNLHRTISEGEKFEKAINDYGSNNSWLNNFKYTDSLAWESDFRDTQMNGNDHKYIDTVDLALFSGHGSKNAFYFGTNNSTHSLTYNHAKWGNNYNLEWIIIDACNVLDNRDNRLVYRWATPTVFSKLHYMFGYVTTTYDVDSRGENFVKYAMKNDFKVRNAWIRSTIISENNTIAAYLRADGGGSDTYNDHLWNNGYTSIDPTGSLTFLYATWSTN